MVFEPIQKQCSGKVENCIGSCSPASFQRTIKVVLETLVLARSNSADEIECFMLNTLILFDQQEDAAMDDKSIVVQKNGICDYQPGIYFTCLK